LRSPERLGFQGSLAGFCKETPQQDAKEEPALHPDYIIPIIKAQNRRECREVDQSSGMPTGYS
jgi:hypothetical protein